MGNGTSCSYHRVGKVHLGVPRSCRFGTRDADEGEDAFRLLLFELGVDVFRDPGHTPELGTAEDVGVVVRIPAAKVVDRDALSRERSMNDAVLGDQRLDHAAAVVVGAGVATVGIMRRLLVGRVGCHTEDGNPLVTEQRRGCEIGEADVVRSEDLEDSVANEEDLVEVVRHEAHLCLGVVFVLLHCGRIWGPGESKPDVKDRKMVKVRGWEVGGRKGQAGEGVCERVCVRVHEG